MQHMLCRQNITYYSKQEKFLSQVNFTVLDGIDIGGGHSISRRGGRQVVLLGYDGRKQANGVCAEHCDCWVGKQVGKAKGTGEIGG
mgnify:CR=1 FL=1